MGGEGTTPTPQEILAHVADKYLKKIDPSTPEEFNGFVNYLEKVRNVLIVDTKLGSLIITVQCRSTQILEELWDDYRTGLVNQKAQEFLITEEVLNELNLTEVNLTTTIPEEQYRTCREKLSLLGESKALV